MAHRIANNGMRNFTHHQPLSVLQAFVCCRRGATVAVGRAGHPATPGARNAVQPGLRAILIQPVIY